MVNIVVRIGGRSERKKVKVKGREEMQWRDVIVVEGYAGERVRNRRDVPKNTKKKDEDRRSKWKRARKF